jgi:hypothetical protein
VSIDALTTPTGNAGDSRNVYWKAAVTRGSRAQREGSQHPHSGAR